MVQKFWHTHFLRHPFSCSCEAYDERITQYIYKLYEQQECKKSWEMVLVVALGGGIHAA